MDSYYARLALEWWYSGADHSLARLEEYTDHFCTVYGATEAGRETALSQARVWYHTRYGEEAACP